MWDKNECDHCRKYEEDYMDIKFRRTYSYDEYDMDDDEYYFCDIKCFKEFLKKYKKEDGTYYLIYNGVYIFDGEDVDSINFLKELIK